MAHVARVVQVVGARQHPGDEVREVARGLLGEGRGEPVHVHRRRGPGQHRPLAALGLREVPGQRVHQPLALAAERLRVIGGCDAVAEVRHGAA